MIGHPRSFRFLLGILGSVVLVSIRNIVERVTQDVIMDSAFKLKLRVSVTDDYVKMVAVLLSKIKVESEELEKGYHRFFGHLVVFVSNANARGSGAPSEGREVKEIKIGVPELDTYLATGHCGEMPCEMNCRPCDDRCNACSSH
jgi:hypothetical protein